MPIVNQSNLSNATNTFLRRSGQTPTQSYGNVGVNPAGGKELNGDVWNEMLALADQGTYDLTKHSGRSRFEKDYRTRTGLGISNDVRRALKYLATNNNAGINGPRHNTDYSFNRMNKMLNRIANYAKGMLLELRYDINGNAYSMDGLNLNGTKVFDLSAKYKTAEEAKAALAARNSALKNSWGQYRQKLGAAKVNLLFLDGLKFTDVKGLQSYLYNQLKDNSLAKALLGKLGTVKGEVFTGDGKYGTGTDALTKLYYNSLTNNDEKNAFAKKMGDLKLGEGESLHGDAKLAKFEYIKEPVDMNEAFLEWSNSEEVKNIQNGSYLAPSNQSNDLAGIVLFDGLTQNSSWTPASSSNNQSLATTSSLNNAETTNQSTAQTSATPALLDTSTTSTSPVTAEGTQASQGPLINLANPTSQTTKRSTPLHKIGGTLKARAMKYLQLGGLVDSEEFEEAAEDETPEYLESLVMNSMQGDENSLAEIDLILKLAESGEAKAQKQYSIILEIIQNLLQILAINAPTIAKRGAKLQYLKHLKKGGNLKMTHYYQEGGNIPSALETVLSNEQIATLFCAMLSLQIGKDIAPNDIAQLIQNPEQALALEQIAQQFILLLQSLTPAARNGAKLSYLKSLRSGCPEGYEVSYYKKGGRLCKECVAKNTVRKETELLKPAFFNKCGGSVKRKYLSGAEMNKCGGKTKKNVCGSKLKKSLKCGGKKCENGSELTVEKKCGGKTKKISKALSGVSIKNFRKYLVPARPTNQRGGRQLVIRGNKYGATYGAPEMDSEGYHLVEHYNGKIGPGNHGNNVRITVTNYTDANGNPVRSDTIATNEKNLEVANRTGVYNSRTGKWESRGTGLSIR